MMYILFASPVATVKKERIHRYCDMSNEEIIRNYEAVRNHDPECDDQCYNDFVLNDKADREVVPFTRDQIVSVREGDLDGVCFGVIRQEDDITVYRIATSNTILSENVVNIGDEPRRVRIAIVADEGYVADSLRDIAAAIENGSVRYHIEDAHYDADFDTDMGEDDAD